MTDIGPTLSRKGVKRLRVPVHMDEEQQIKANAAKTGLSLAEYLRRLGLGFEPRSLLDEQHILTLAQINADLGRLGGLLKLWLTNEARWEEVKPLTIRTLLHRIEQTQRAMLAVIQRL